jgi:predicted ATPase/DNA-binding XRE family transcriptional regulator
MEEFVSFGEWVRRRRKVLDLTRVGLADLVACSADMIKKIERDERRPSLQLAELLAEQLHIPEQATGKFVQMARGKYVPKLGSPMDLSIRAPAKAIRSNLPQQVTPFIGREAELAEIAALLEDPDCRLLTLVGPGGIGKTRLALAVAEKIAEAKRNVTFVSLAQADSPEFIITAIADALEIKFYGQADPRDQLLDYLENKSLLLVLDNFEQLLPPFAYPAKRDEKATNQESTALILEIIRRAPQVTCLVTSRERLSLYGEWAFAVEGLGVPRGDPGGDIEAYSAVTLFVQSARRADFRFTHQPENSQDIIRICQLVGGMPLGLELAAAWVAVLPCAEIAQEIKHNLDFLATSMQGLPERHRTIRAVFDTSWHRLTAPERVVFKRLSVFRGDFTWEAADVICGEWRSEAAVGPSIKPQATPAASDSMLHVLSLLVEKSFLRRNSRGRYVVHELMRQYGTEKLAQSATDEVTTRTRHGEYYLTFLAQQEARLKGSDQRVAAGEVAAERENVYSAWQWAVAQGRVDLILQSAEALWKYSDTRGRYHLNDLLFGQATARLQQGPDTARGSNQQRDLALAKLLIFQGGWSMRLGALTEATALLTDCIHLLRRLKAGRELALALNMLAAAIHLQGDYGQEQQLLQESITLAQAAGDRWVAGYSLNDLGMAIYLLGDAAEAQRFSHEALAIFREIGDLRGLGFALHNLGIFARHLGQYSEAERLLQESLSLRQENDDPWGMASTLIQLGAVAQAKGNFSTAKANLQNAIRTAQQIRAMPLLLDALVALAALLISTGEVDEAGDILHLGLQHPSLSKRTAEKAKWLLNELPALATQSAVEAPQLNIDAALELLVQRYAAQ